MEQFQSEPLLDLGDEATSGRQVPRDSLFLMAELRVGGDSATLPVRVRNLSAGGLMAEYPPGLDQGVTVDVFVRGIGWINGKIAWSAAGRVGIAFDRPVDPMLARKPVGTGATTPVYAKAIKIGR